MISNAPITNPQTDAGGLPALAWTGWYTQVAGALTAFNQNGAIPNNTALYLLAPGNQWKGARMYQDAANNFSIDANTRTSVSGSDAWVSALKVNSGGGVTLAANAQIAHAGQASLDLWNTNSGTPAGGAHWRIFADNVGGGGGNLTFGIFDVVNARVPFGIDNNGVVTFNQPQNIAFGSGYRSWTPTFGGSGAMIITASFVSEAIYLRIGPNVYYHVKVNLTFGGGANASCSISTPVTQVGDWQGACSHSTGPSIPWQATFGLVLGNNFFVYAPNGGNWPLGSPVTFDLNGIYRCV